MCGATAVGEPEADPHGTTGKERAQDDIRVALLAPAMACELEGMLWRRPHEPPGNRSCKPLLSLEPPLGLGVKASLRRFAALTPASLRLERQCGSRWLPLLHELRSR